MKVDRIQLCIVLALTGWAQSSFAAGQVEGKGSPEQTSPHVAADSPCQTIPNDLPICPLNGGKFQLLPEHFPPAGLYIGYSSGIGMEKMLASILEAMLKYGVSAKLNIMFPRDDTGKTFQELYQLSKLDTSARILNFIPARADESLWAQDYFIAGTADGKRLVIADLPYSQREGEAIPEDIALSCRADYVDLNPRPDFHAEPGDYGGNIEPMPGGFLVVGNTLSKTVGQVIAKNTKQTMLPVKVDWLETGHADEMITVVPDKTSSAPCNFALLYASPAHAFEVVGKNPRKVITFWGDSPSWQEDMSIPHPDYAECLSGKVTKRCKDFVKSNKTYELLIGKEVREVHKRISTVTGCKEVKLLPLPQLFYTDVHARQYGTSQDKAQALNPNSTNLIAMHNFAVVPEQSYGPFQTSVESTLKSLGMQTLAVDAAYYHLLGGGLHCISTVQRACQVRIAKKK